MVRHIIDRSSSEEMELLLAIGIPIIVLGIAYLLIKNNQGLPLLLQRIADNNGSIWTYGVIAIAVLSLVKYASN